MLIRPHEPGDYETVRRIYAEAFRKPESPESVPWESDLFGELLAAGDVVHELSFTAVKDDVAVGHVTASKATVATHPVVAVGPIGVLPEHQGRGIGTALMHAHLDAADTAGVPLIVLLGSPRYYGRFGFRRAEEMGVISPEPTWGDAFQARPLTAYTPAVRGLFAYAPAFSP